MQPPILPVGFESFHRNRLINYQLNRLHSLGFVEPEELVDAAGRIRSFADCVVEFESLSARAVTDGDLAAGAFYARAAELFTPPQSGNKLPRYLRFVNLFDVAFARLAIPRREVPYRGRVLPARWMAARGPHRGTVVFFGGLDSIVEEFLGIWWRIAEAGFNVVAFDGPGQGGARTLRGVVSEHDWEHPVSAVLDHFGLQDVALVGLSSGGYSAIRAAAYEPRVSRVVAWPPVYDWLERVPGALRRPVRRMGRPRWTKANLAMRMRLSPTLRYAIDQAAYVAGGDGPADAVRWFRAMNAMHLSSERVFQDVALVGGEGDSFQPIMLLQRQEAALVNARSVTTRVFTAAEQADQHCQIGNLGLATAWVTDWLAVHR